MGIFILENEIKEKILGINLIRYWEKDINERPEWVIFNLNERLSL